MAACPRGGYGMAASCAPGSRLAASYLIGSDAPLNIENPSCWHYPGRPFKLVPPGTGFRTGRALSQESAGGIVSLAGAIPGVEPNAHVNGIAHCGFASSTTYTASLFARSTMDRPSFW